jgi:hypothetical protein
MKIRKAFLILKTVLLSIVLISCGGGDVNPNGSTVDIYIDFWNTSGKSPEIRFDELKTSREIKIDFTKRSEEHTSELQSPHQ